MSVGGDDLTEYRPGEPSEADEAYFEEAEEDEGYERDELESLQ